MPSRSAASRKSATVGFWNMVDPCRSACDRILTPGWSEARSRDDHAHTIKCKARLTREHRAKENAGIARRTRAWLDPGLRRADRVSRGNRGPVPITARGCEPVLHAGKAALR